MLPFTIYMVLSFAVYCLPRYCHSLYILSPGASICYIHCSAIRCLLLVLPFAIYTVSPDAAIRCLLSPPVLPFVIYTVPRCFHLLYTLFCHSLSTLSHGAPVSPGAAIRYIHCLPWCCHSLSTVSPGAAIHYIHCPRSAAIHCLLSPLVLLFTIYTVSPGATIHCLLSSLVLPFPIYNVSPGAAIAVYSLPRCFHCVCVCVVLCPSTWLIGCAHVKELVRPFLLVSSHLSVLSVPAVFLLVISSYIV